MHAEQPNFRPLDDLALIASLIDGHAQDASDMVRSMRSGQRPAVLDDALVERVDLQYRETADFVQIYQQQLALWKAGSPTPSQSFELARLQAVVTQLDRNVAEVLALVASARKITIDAIQRTSDFDLGLATLLGDFPPP
jgi:hypothetical protein